MSDSRPVISDSQRARGDSRPVIVRNRLGRLKESRAAADGPGMINAIHSANDGLTAALERFDRAAAVLSGAGARDEDVVAAMASLRTEQVAISANALVARTADQMLGTVIDLLA